MTRRHAYAARAAQIAHRPRKRGNRGNVRVHVRVHAIRREDGRCRAHEELAVVAAVARDGDARVLEMCVQVVGEPLRGASHSVDVHAVRARAERAAKARRPKGEVLKESVGERGLIPCFRCFLHARKLGSKVGFRHVFDPSRHFGMHIARVHFCSFLYASRPRKAPGRGVRCVTLGALCAGPYSASFFARSWLMTLGLPWPRICFMHWPTKNPMTLVFPSL